MPFLTPFTQRVPWLVPVVCVFLSAIACRADVQVWLMLSPDKSDAVLSSDSAERDRLIKGGWAINGTGLLKLEAAPHSAPLHRLVKSMPGGASRLLATDVSQIAAAKKEGYVDEGSLGYASVQARPDCTPIFHVINAGRHLWFMNVADRIAAEKNGWKSVPPRFWLWSKNPSNPASLDVAPQEPKSSGSLEPEPKPKPTPGTDLPQR